MASRTPDPVESLLKSGPRRTALPEPAQRARLRTDYGLSQAEVAEALGVARNTVAGWESGRSEPQGATRAAYAKLLEGMAAQLAPRSEAVPPAQTAHTGQEPPAPSTTPQTTPARQDTSRRRPAAHDGPRAKTAARATATAPADRRLGPRAKTAPRETAAAPADPRFADGPLVVLDGDGTAYGVGGIVLDCPATDLPALVDWALWEAKLGAPRLHRHGKDADPLIVLTDRAADRLGLPLVLEDRRGLRLPDDHQAVRGLARAEWQLTRRGFGPWARIYRPAREGRRQCVQLAVLPWGALDTRAWGNADQLEAPELAQVLGDYATRVITPRGSAAVCGLELMTALRPPTRPVKDEATGTWASGPNSGALTRAVDPAPPEAPDEHPVVASLYPRGHRRTAAEVLDEEAYEWIRDPELLTDSECARQFAVGVDVNMAFAAAANRLTLGLGAPVHVKAPVFDKTVPGSWLVDLSHIDFDPRLPNPFTPHGARPEGPAWYATPTVAYAAELGHDVTPIEAHVRPESGPYLDAWYTRLRDAYMAVMERPRRRLRHERSGLPRRDGAPQGCRPRPGRRAVRDQVNRQGRHRQAARTPPGRRLPARAALAVPWNAPPGGPTSAPRSSPRPASTCTAKCSNSPTAQGCSRSPCCPTAPSTSPTVPARWTSCPARPTASRCRAASASAYRPAWSSTKARSRCCGQHRCSTKATIPPGTSRAPTPPHSESRRPVGIFGDSLEKATANTFTRPSPSLARRSDAVPRQAATRAPPRPPPNAWASPSAPWSATSPARSSAPARTSPPVSPRRCADAGSPASASGPRSRPPRPAASSSRPAPGFGFTAAPGTTDDARIRLITQHLPPAYAARLFDAHAAGATDQQLQDIAAEGLQEIYFKDRGRRAPGLQVEFTDIDYVEIDF